MFEICCLERMTMISVKILGWAGGVLSVFCFVFLNEEFIMWGLNAVCRWTYKPKQLDYVLCNGCLSTGP